MDFTFVYNNSFSIFEINFLILFFKKFFYLKIEFHLMTKFFLKNKIKKYFHFENNIKKNNFSIGNNFCWNNLLLLKKKFLIMSVIPGFSNQFFLKKTKKIFFKKSNIDGGINLFIYKKIKNYFNKIIIGSKIIDKKLYFTYFYYNFIKNEFIL